MLPSNRSPGAMSSSVSNVSGTVPPYLWLIGASAYPRRHSRELRHVCRRRKCRSPCHPPPLSLHLRRRSTIRKFLVDELMRSRPGVVRGRRLPCNGPLSPGFTFVIRTAGSIHSPGASEIHCMKGRSSVRFNSRLAVAAVVSVATLLVCWFGIRAELKESRPASSARGYPPDQFDAGAAE